MVYQPDPAVPAWYDPDDEVPPSRLIPGVKVRRYTEPASAGRVAVPVPCCGRWATIRATHTDDQTTIGCSSCDLVYAATVIDENDGGFGGADDRSYAAVLTVQAEGITIARHRPHRRRPR